MVLWSKKISGHKQCRPKIEYIFKKTCTTQFSSHILIYLDLKGHPTPNWLWVTYIIKGKENNEQEKNEWT